MKTLKIVSIELDEYPGRVIRPIHLSELKNINVILGKNGSGKTTLAQALSGIIRREPLKRGQKPWEVYGKIKGVAYLDNERIEFNTDTDKEENIWSVPIGAPKESFFDLDLGSLLNSDIDSYSALLSVIGSGDLDLKYNSKAPNKSNVSDVKKIVSRIQKLDTEITNNKDCERKAEECLSEIEENEKRIEECSENVRVGEILKDLEKAEELNAEGEKLKEKLEDFPHSLKKIEENSDKCEKINKLHNSINENEIKYNDSYAFIPPYEGLNFQPGKNYSSFLGELSDFERKERELYSFPKSAAEEEFRRLETEINCLEEKLAGEKYREINLFRREDLLAPDETAENLKVLYKKEALSLVLSKMSKKTLLPFYIFSGLLAVLCIILFLLGCGKYSWLSLLGLLGCFGILPLADYNKEIEIIKGENENTETKIPDAKLIWQRSLFESYEKDCKELSDLRLSLKTKKELFADYEKREKDLRDSYAEFLSDYPEFSPIWDLPVSDFIYKFRKDYEKFEKSENKKSEGEALLKYTENLRKELKSLLGELGFAEFRSFEEDYARLKEYLNVKNSYDICRSNARKIRENITADPELLSFSKEERNEKIRNIEIHSNEIINLKAKNQSLRKEIERLEETSSASLTKEKNECLLRVRRECHSYMSAYSLWFVKKYVAEQGAFFAENVRDRTRALFNAFAKSKYRMNEEDEIIDLNTGAGIDYKNLSSGTKTQLFLAAKLSVIEASENDIAYPLFLDESLASSDPKSAEEIFTILPTLSRQIFLLSPKPLSASGFNEIILG
ncbi:MAG: hypothetical protein KBT47_07080 [Armatimonadetes bacterium]|nr:hypothetical protein [Candidatus Hippobium faecium]